MQKLMYVARHSYNYYHYHILRSNKYVVVKIAKVRVSCHTGMLMAKIDIGYRWGWGMGIAKIDTSTYNFYERCP